MLLLIFILFVFAFSFNQEIFGNFAEKLGFNKTELAGSVLDSVNSYNAVLDERVEPVNIVNEDIASVELPEIQSLEDQLDDIAEKIDVIRQEIALLLAESLVSVEKVKEPEKELVQENGENIEENVNEEVVVVENNYTGGGSVVYPKILISEVMISGLNDDKEEFVELYNPTGNYIDLTGWYLQRKTKTAENYSSFAPGNLFEGKMIGSNDYFIIAREGSSYITYADIIIDKPLTEDNSLVLKNPKREISDKVGWGMAQDYELLPSQAPEAGLSIGRKIISENVWDGDNNSFDFELQTPTPNAKNIKYVKTEEPKLPVLKNILISEVQISPINQRFVKLYNPNDYEVDLTGYYLQRKTESAGSNDVWGSFVSSSNFKGKIVGSNDYFLISREIEGSDILLDITLSKNNSLALKKPDKTIIDKVGWGSAKDYETLPAINPGDGQSLTRICDEIIKNYKDSDNNLIDFEIYSPSP